MKTPTFERMYTREQASLLRRQFWTAFGQYMAPVPAANDQDVTWLNYRTGEKDVHFRLQSDQKKAIVSITLTHADAGIRQLYFDQFLQLKALLHQYLNEEWLWAKDIADEGGKPISKIYTERNGVSIMRKEDWPALISFFKPRIVALDAFWSDANYVFESLH